MVRVVVELASDRGKARTEPHPFLQLRVVTDAPSKSNLGRGSRRGRRRGKRKRKKKRRKRKRKKRWRVTTGRGSEEMKEKKCRKKKGERKEGKREIAK